ncbi:hypothetical protein QYG_4693 [Escherichia coli B7-1]|nr:hypothetical protein EDL933_4952 [Escherichia coli O157:H7 str. EDL933]EDU87947.1 hypothetical protein ECH7EC4501_0969 [Escherichia coli O157:H7 str. EC4501]EGD65476.1 hypothetical protein ECF_03276 [Escherichia coli O157:H7 str. 1125]EHV33460.1 hypothetical protein ECDEC5C_4509 [Escherichia coli DEC5C]ERC26358.1 hypothetical protein QYG_4693 [Escherichia coli B7-1]ERD07116.1 hypothetical protein S3C_4467 [Escherichia coli B105]ERE30454.1 hypothetical protein B232_4573 [Escherichia coli Tx
MGIAITSLFGYSLQELVSQFAMINHKVRLHGHEPHTRGSRTRLHCSSGNRRFKRLCSRLN